MSTDTDTDGHARHADDDTRIPDRCAFCDSENMDAGTRWSHVHRHSHEGTKTVVIRCEDCGGALITRYVGSKRGNQLGNETETGSTWHIPSRYSLIVCPDCGEILRWCDHNDDDDATFVGYIATIGRETPCGVPAVVVQGEYERNGRGRPVEGIPFEEVA